MFFVTRFFPSTNCIPEFFGPFLRYSYTILHVALCNHSVMTMNTGQIHDITTLLSTYKSCDLKSSDKTLVLQSLSASWKSKRTAATTIANTIL